VELIFGLPWIADLATSIRLITGFVYFIVFTSFLLGRKTTGALNALSAPETDYSSASYALTVVINFGDWALSTGELCFGMPWIADLAASINVITGFA
jgi:hypothetical protein